MSNAVRHRKHKDDNDIIFLNQHTAANGNASASASANPNANVYTNAHTTNGSSNSHEKNKRQKSSSSQASFLARVLLLRRSKSFYLVLVLWLYIFGPTALQIPHAIFVWASHGFVTESLLGAGLRGLVGGMVKDPSQLMVGDVTPPTPLAAYKDILLAEYEEYRKKHEIPIISNLDPDEQGPLDTKGEWKTLFLKAMGRYTCAAPHFPRTLEAVRNSGLTAYSIMFSRLAPGQIIEPHTGFSKMIQIYHLALKVPIQDSPVKDANNLPLRPFLTVKQCEDEDEQEPPNQTKNCRMEKYEWTEGREFIFDDSFTHYAENPTDSERLVLFLHIKRVDFKGWREELIASIMCYIFSWVPFESVLKLVRGTEATCALDDAATSGGALRGGAAAPAP